MRLQAAKYEYGCDCDKRQNCDLNGIEFAFDFCDAHDVHFAHARINEYGCDKTDLHDCIAAPTVHAHAVERCGYVAESKGQKQRKQTADAYAQKIN